jgi:HK97 family phage prohead protease
VSRFTIEHKSVPTEFKADIEKREITGYASVFGNVDMGGDVVKRGAYTKTLAEDLPAGRIKVKRNHQTLIGRPIHAEQDSKGLLTVSRISKTPLGDETLTLAKDGVIDSMSIGYRAEQKTYGQQDGRTVRNLEVLRLNEWSFLDDPPMNPDAVVTGVKVRDGGGDVFARMQSALEALERLYDAAAATTAERQLRELLMAFRAHLGR